MRWLRLLSLPVLTGIAATTACGDAPSPGAGGPGIEDLPALQLEEELRIGSLDDPDVGFTEIGRVELGPDGHLYVAESRDRQLRVYAEDGRLLRSFGRAGEGPGEFSHVSRFGFQGDTLWIGDFLRGRVTLFSLSTGAVLGTVTGRVDVEVPPPLPGVRATPPAASSLGGPHVYLSHLRADGTFGSSPVAVVYRGLSDSTAAFPIVRFDAAGAIIDTIEVLERRVSYTSREVPLEGRPPVLVQLDPPPEEHSRLRVEFGEDVIETDWGIPTPAAADAVFHVTRTGERGDTVYRRTFRYQPIPVLPDYVDGMARRSVRGDMTPRDSQRLFEATRAGMQVPPFHPPIRWVQVGGDGAPWILLQDPAGEPVYAQPLALVGERTPWLVLDPEGRARGTLHVPSSVAVQWTEGDRVWASEADDFGVPWLVRYRLVVDPP